jgi:hypothetical protein
VTIPRELSPHECQELIRDGGIGRLALCTPTGPQIFPLNFTVDGKSIVFRTTPHGTLGNLRWGLDVAFETDHLNWSTRQGWSVIVKGRADVIDDPSEVERLRELGHEPRPWAKGVRRIYVRVAWREITGRVVGDEWLSSSPPAAQGWNL